MQNLSIKEQFLGAIAFAGDLSMGQPVEHSPRVALLAVYLVDALQLKASYRVNAARVGLMRWAGCTANARDFSELLGDDIRGRSELLAGRNPFITKHPEISSLSGHMPSLANAHCEAMAQIAIRAGISSPEVGSEHQIDNLLPSISDLFENWDGSGYPTGKKGEDIDLVAQIVAVVSDLEIYTRQYGLNRALMLIESRGGKIYDASLALKVGQHASRWLEQIDDKNTLLESLRFAEVHQLGNENKSELDDIVTLFSDYAALKQPEAIRVSRLAASYAQQISSCLGLEHEKCLRIVRAAKLHRLGFVSVPNGVLAKQAISNQWMDESLRLASYWTERILSRSPILSKETAIASMAFERLDGSGHYRGLAAPSIPIEARVLQVSVLLAERFSDLRHNAKERKAAVELLGDALKVQLVDATVVDAALAVLSGESIVSVSKIELTPREKDVLQSLTLGLSNKEVARDLDISPKTVNAHLEKIYKKLGVSGRTAATMKALEYGLM
ncbi:hypothetical protein EYS14_05090 [Alteromonadaceae bacterium M269]|nr:hypothetical protein EYS14_05090 [Alteromonadaceae bacterium M269]